MTTITQGTRTGDAGSSETLPAVESGTETSTSQSPQQQVAPIDTDGTTTVITTTINLDQIEIGQRALQDLGDIGEQIDSGRANISDGK